MTSTYPTYAATAPAQVAAQLAAGMATIPRCGGCKARFYYHRPRCPRCFSSEIAWEVVDEPLVVRASCVVHRQQNELLAMQGPVLMVAAALDDELTIIAEGQGWATGDRPLAGGLVRYRVTKRPDGTPVPVFVPWAPS